MIWKKRGYEFDEIANRYCEIYSNILYIFGCGKKGKRLQELMRDIASNIIFIDNAEEKIGEMVLGSPVISLEQYLEEKKAPIVCAVGNQFLNDVVQQLHKAGLGRDFCTYSEFMENIFPILALYKKNHLYLDVVQLSVTERCTLRCKKCAHGCNYVKGDHKDMELSDVEKSLDFLFRQVDYVDNFYLIGGEPLLYQELVDAVVMIGKHYRNRIGRMIITTNGTILPAENLLLSCREYGVFFYISNYGKQIPKLKKRYGKICELLERNQINYSIFEEDVEWMDYGFDHVDHGKKVPVMREVFEHCKTPCREIRGQRFYYCIQARAAGENMGFCDNDNDYLDLSDLPSERAKHVILEYAKGFSDKGYLDMCNYCNGAEAVNYPLPAAEQMEAESE